MLEQLAEAINKRFEGARASVAYDPYGLIIPTKEGGAHYYPDESSYSNAHFVDWGLNRLDELGAFMPFGFTRYNHPELGYAFLNMNWTPRHFAPTRAEAVARALLAALEGK